MPLLAPAIDKTSIFEYLNHSFLPINLQHEKNMPKNWPSQPGPEVAVFVDFANLVRGYDDLYQGSFSTSKVINQLNRISRQVGERVHMAVYLDTENYKCYEPLNYMELGLAAKATGVKVVNVHPKDGRDNVDAVMIEDMLALNRFPDRSLPFLVATADRDFIPVVTEIGQRRQVYIGIPAQNMMPGIAHVGAGWNFIDRLCHRHMALHDALAWRESPDPEYIRFAMNMFPDYYSAWMIINSFLDALDPFPPCFCPSEVVAVMKHRLAKRYPSMPENAWWYYVRALEYYGVIGQDLDQNYCGTRFSLYSDHPAFKRTRQLQAS